jgi:hypothetical protein
MNVIKPASLARGRRQRVLSGLLALLMVSTMAAGTVFGLGPSTVRAQADSLETAALAPESTLIYMSVQLDTEGEQWTLAEELLGRLGVPSVEEAIAQSGETMTSEDMALLEDLEVFLGGEVGIVITSLAAAQEAGSELSSEAGLGAVSDALPVGSPEATAPGEGEGFAAIARPEDAAAAWTAVEDLFQQNATDSGQTIVEEEYEGVTILTLPGDEFDSSSGAAAAQLDDFIVLAATPADIEPIIDVHQGNAPALADEEHFQEISAAFTEPRLAFFYVNGPELFAQAMSGVDMSELEEMGQFGDLFTNAINAYSAGTVSAEENGFRFDSLTMPGESGELPPTPANFTPTLPDKVPSNTVLMAAGADLGATGTLDVLALLFVQGMLGIDPSATPVPSQSPEEYAAELFEQSAQLLGFNIKTDVIDQLVGEYGLALWGIETLDPTQINALFISGVSDTTVFGGALAQISLLIQSGAQGQVSITTREIGTDLLNIVDLSPTGTPVIVEYGILGGEFVVGVNNGITEYASGASDPLSANPNYQSALSSLPSEHNSITYIDLSQLVPLYETFVGSMSASSEDASEKCAEFSTQEAAQEAYDADAATNWELDLDFDGTACEDFFAPASPAAESTEIDLSKLSAIAVVGYQQDGMTGSSGILVIAE